MDQLEGCRNKERLRTAALQLVCVQSIVVCNIEYM